MTKKKRVAPKSRTMDRWAAKAEALEGSVVELEKHVAALEKHLSEPVK